MVTSFSRTKTRGLGGQTHGPSSNPTSVKSRSTVPRSGPKPHWVKLPSFVPKGWSFPGGYGLWSLCTWTTTIKVCHSPGSSPGQLQHRAEFNPTQELWFKKQHCVLGWGWLCLVRFALLLPKAPTSSPPERRHFSFVSQGLELPAHW